MTVNGWIVGFLISFSAMMLCCRKGDDDVVYKFFERKPTADEAKQRIRYVLAKFAAAISGAGLLVIFSVKFLIAELGLKLSPSQNKTAIILDRKSVV